MINYIYALKITGEVGFDNFFEKFYSKCLNVSIIVLTIST